MIPPSPPPSDDPPPQAPDRPDSRLEKIRFQVNIFINLFIVIHRYHFIHTYYLFQVTLEEGEGSEGEGGM